MAKMPQRALTTRGAKPVFSRHIESGAVQQLSFTLKYPSFFFAIY
jgi:hypothetical protein